MRSNQQIDWTGVNPPDAPVDPLTPETFVQRLESLTRAVQSLEKLRAAFVAQNPEFARGFSEISRGAD